MKAEMDWPIFLGGILLVLWLGFSIASLYAVYETRSNYQMIGALQGENKMLYNQLVDYETQLGLLKGKGRRDETHKRLPKTAGKGTDATTNK
jgi:hypothetical protein